MPADSVDFGALDSGFFVSAAVASRRDEALPLLREERGSTTDRQKFGFLEGALERA